jgi:hypothetical protein
MPVFMSVVANASTLLCMAVPVVTRHANIHQLGPSSSIFSALTQLLVEQADLPVH